MGNGAVKRQNKSSLAGACAMQRADLFVAMKEKDKISNPQKSCVSR